jgi:hypothetical protein
MPWLPAGGSEPGYIADRWAGFTCPASWFHVKHQIFAPEAFFFQPLGSGVSLFHVKHSTVDKRRLR